MAYSKITLGGCQTVDLLYIGGDIDFDDVNIDSSVPDWDDNTIMIASFDDDLNAGNVELGKTLSGNNIYRKKAGSSKMEYVKTLGTEDKYIVDYMVKNDSDYTYYLFPVSDDKVFPPVVSNTVNVSNKEWCLMVVDETDSKNVFTLSKMFKFGLNLSTGDMSTNNHVNILNNFTPYPKIQKGNSNYWSGSLSSLIGFVHCTDDYVQTPNMIEELKSLAIDGRRKFLKDIEGHIFEIEIADSINISTEDNVIEQPKTASIKWVEIGGIDGISIVNPIQITSWLLTNTGTPLSYVTYNWDDSSEWDDNKYWTEPVEVGNVSTYIGREINGGDDI